jgi:hypothetical protein
VCTVPRVLFVVHFTLMLRLCSRFDCANNTELKFILRKRLRDAQTDLIRVTNSLKGSATAFRERRTAKKALVALAKSAKTVAPGAPCVEDTKRARKSADDEFLVMESKQSVPKGEAVATEQMDDWAIIDKTHEITIGAQSEFANISISRHARERLQKALLQTIGDLRAQLKDLGDGDDNAPASFSAVLAGRSAHTGDARDVTGLFEGCSLSPATSAASAQSQLH